MPVVNINERSWGIDLISCINEFLIDKELVIKRAGGENSLKAPKNTMFPDVLLFGDSQSARVLQGWELKMPDTDIDDEEFINNAHTKAKILKLNSFLLWNVNYARLYMIGDEDSIHVVKEWSLSRILTTRREVKDSRELWLNLLKTIIIDVNEYINTGTIRSAKISESLTSDDIVNFIVDNNQILIDEYLNKIASDSNFQDSINLWWNSVKAEYPEDTNCLEILANINILSWINKFIFANLIKRHFTQANSIENIIYETTIQEAIDIIENISRNCDFWNIFKKQLGNEILPDLLWNDLKILNSFLIDAQVQNIDQSDWQHIFESIISTKHRKLYGQYATPQKLAKLLVNLTVNNKNLKVLDPCCGTGTIAKEVLNLKKQYCTNKEAIYEKIWASDKIAFPLQLATVSLFAPDESREIINIFQEDVANLNIGNNITFYDPTSGREIQKTLPQFDYIVSNLPFVKGQDIPEYNESIRSINDFIVQNIGEIYRLDSRADIAYYIPFKLWTILNNESKLGIIISNSWLGTTAGKKFREALLKYFDIENVVTSGNGRWFDNAKVVTNILVLKKNISINNDPIINENKICFSTLKQKIEDLDIDSNITYIRDNNSRDNNIVRKVMYSLQEINDLEALGVQWSALFTDLKWLNNLSQKLVPINTFFNIGRGERRGWDALFYPETENSIEPEFLKPFLKTIRSVDSLIASSDGMAFCCNKDMETLRCHYRGAYAWINKFINARNNTNRPLPEVLSRPNMYWYEMKDDTTADLITSINPDDRIFVAKFDTPTFVNQRLIRFTKNSNEIDVTIAHALLNSLLGIFYIEMLGFGRGEGVLDLSSSKLSAYLHILNYNLLNENAKQRIINAFQPLIIRDVKPLTEELESADRIEFDQVVLDAFGISSEKENIIKSLMEIYNIRKAVRR